MKKKINLILFSSLLPIMLFGQKAPDQSGKPSITPAQFGKWPYLNGASISNDGKYICYTIQDPTNGATIWIQSLRSGWKQDTKSSVGQFSDNSQWFVFKNDRDSLGLLSLDSRKVEYITNVASFKLSKGEKAQRLAYWLKTSKTLILRSLIGGHADSITSATNYFFDKSGNSLLVDKINDTGCQQLQWVNLNNSKVYPIWTSSVKDSKAANFVFADNASLMAFTVTGSKGKSIWTYQTGFSAASILIDDQIPNLESGFSIEGIGYNGFTPDARNLFISLKEKAIPPPMLRGANVDIWSYTDDRLQPEQLKRINPKIYGAIIRLGDRKITRLEYENERISWYNNDHVMITKCLRLGGASDEWYWNRKAQSSISLVSLSGGNRKLIGHNIPEMLARSYILSPGGKYIIYYDAGRKNYFSYEISTGIRRNLTSGTHSQWTTYVKRDIPMAPYMPIYCGVWIKEDKAVLLYDQCDIYQVDPSGKTRPVNLTGGYGKIHNIEFRMATEPENQRFAGNETIIVSAFDRVNKNDGFYNITLGESRIPQLLISQPYKFKGTSEDDHARPEVPIKAKDADVYLLKKMSAEEYPNYYWTSDFRTFNALTNLHPENNWNWMTSELKTWKTPDGSFCQGILFKPQNMDPKKKYPLIFNYYENSTEGLHNFLTPEMTSGSLNIPYYVSNGYLVFMPDMHYELGHPGHSVVKTVVSAAKYLTQLPYVDSKHMAIQGHSRGGWETNFLVTHTHLFAAAMSSSGFCDYVSLYDGVSTSGQSRQSAYETRYQRIGNTLWSRPDLYIENSPIFKADEVTTPLLMMNNKNDNDIPFEQGVEFFTALRRLGKKVWMLQYDGEDHIVDGKASADLETRMKQFFDYYLKSAPCPKWMLDGISASRKGIDDGLGLDTNGREPGQGLLKGLVNTKTKL